MRIIFALSPGVQEKQPAANSTKGVVGHTGRKRPNAPSPKSIKPVLTSKIFFIMV